jgi:2-polyprenyl-3-methyl-5-hydroxy-6-metoxy-1,4-benzoquinol methylase
MSKVMRRLKQSHLDFTKEALLPAYFTNKDRVQEIMEYGERITHLYPNNCFYAHLSLYYLALSFIKEGDKILDAGSGSGYGTAYFASKGNYEVMGIELSFKAVAFSRRHFRMHNLVYKQMDLENIRGFKCDYFDLIFSSNVLEHLESVTSFLRATVDILKPDGRLFIVVPSITCEAQRKDNIGIFQHLNIWSPEQWDHILRKYFTRVQCFSHIGKNNAAKGNFNNSPDEDTFSEEDFELKKVDVRDLGRTEPTFGAVFLAESPIKEIALHNSKVALDFIDASFTRPRPFVSQFNCTSHLSEIFSQTKVVQSFSTKETICQLDIMFAAFGRLNTCDIIVRLKDDMSSNTDLVCETIPASLIGDNEWQEIVFQPLQAKNGILYIVIESPGAVPGNAFTVRASDVKCFTEGTLQINGTTVNQDITFRVFNPTAAYFSYRKRMGKNNLPETFEGMEG